MGIQACWRRALQNTVSGNVIDIRDQLGDPDANEVLNNSIGRNPICLDDTPGAHVGDSNQPPDVVGGKAIGECASRAISTIVPNARDGSDSWPRAAGGRLPSRPRPQSSASAAGRLRP